MATPILAHSGPVILDDREHAARLLALADLFARAARHPPAASGYASAQLIDDGLAALADDWLDELAGRLSPPGQS